MAYDALILGGGVIGLSIAYELSRGGARVGIVERGDVGREASWAGAGILPPAGTIPSGDPLEALGDASAALHSTWAERLREETGIDNGYRRCGAIYLANDDELRNWRRRGIRHAELSPTDLVALEPTLAGSQRFGRAVHLPDEAQLRNPRHLRALEAACRKHGVELHRHAAVTKLHVEHDRVVAAETTSGRFNAASYCVAAGAWSARLLEPLGIRVAIHPVRGQMVLFTTPPGTLHRIINDGPRYLVPRDDGHILAGSTEEDAGFDCRTTDDAIAGLIEFAHHLAPGLANAPIERTWAGLRPGSGDDLPYIGRLPNLANAFIAAGHYRNGLYLSPATAVVMGQLIRRETPTLDLRSFVIDRSIPTQVN